MLMVVPKAFTVYFLPIQDPSVAFLQVRVWALGPNRKRLEMLHWYTIF